MPPGSKSKKWSPIQESKTQGSEITVFPTEGESFSLGPAEVTWRKEIHSSLSSCLSGVTIFLSKEQWHALSRIGGRCRLRWIHDDGSPVTAPRDSSEDPPPPGGSPRRYQLNFPTVDFLS